MTTLKNTVKAMFVKYCKITKSKNKIYGGMHEGSNFKTFSF